MEFKEKELERADAKLLLKEYEISKIDTSGMIDAEIHNHSLLLQVLK